MNSVSPLLVAVVPAAGIGSRMAADRPKQYLSVNGKTILEHTVERLLAHPQISKVILALAADDPYFPLLPLAQDHRVIRVDGGRERADSVLNGLHQALADDAQWVLVHDAARPCLPLADIDALLAEVDGRVDGGLLAMPVRDTMKRSAPDGCVDHTVNREQLWHALTPQLFPVKALRDAITAAMAAGISVTDEASAMEWAGYHPKLVTGSDCNLKITRPDDLKLAAFFLQHEEQN